MTTLLTILHVFICLVLIGVVLLQSGRAGGMGVLSGAATQTVFGGRGAGGFLQTLTAVCAILFMLTCSTLAWLSSSTRDRGLVSATTTTTTPAGRAHGAGAGSHAPAPSTAAPPAAPAPTNAAPPTTAPAPAPSGPSTEGPSAPAPSGTAAEAPAAPPAPAAH